MIDFHYRVSPDVACGYLSEAAGVNLAKMRYEQYALASLLATPPVQFFHRIGSKPPYIFSKLSKLFHYLHPPVVHGTYSVALPMYVEEVNLHVMKKA